MFFQKALKAENARYLIVGAVTASLYFGIIVLCTEVIRMEYRLSLSIAYAMSVFFHFLANRTFTFAAQKRGIKNQIIRYLVILLVNYIITLGVIFFTVDQLGISHYIAAIFAIVATVAVGYLASKFWIFNKKEHIHVK